MKVKNVTDVDGFFRAIEKCRGTVELVSAEGDRINLKSSLCRMLTAARIFSNQSFIEELELVVHDPSDMDYLMKYLTETADESGPRKK